MTNKYNDVCLSQCGGVCQIKRQGTPSHNQFCGAIDTTTRKYKTGIPTYALCRSTSGDWEKNKIHCKDLPIFNSGVCTNTCSTFTKKEMCTNKGCRWSPFGCGPPEIDPCQTILNRDSCAASTNNCRWTTWPNIAPIDGEIIGTQSQAKYGPNPLPPATATTNHCADYCRCSPPHEKC